MFLRSQRLLFAAAVVVIAVAVAFIALTRDRTAPIVAPPARPASPAPANPEAIALAPDGGRLAYAAPGPDGRTALWIRSLDSTDARMLAGTERAGAPDWSPDGRFIVFGAGGELQTVEAAGGEPRRLADLQGTHRGSSWNRDGVIVFGSGNVLRRVSANGGQSTPVTELMPGETFHALPWFLPDGHHFLFVAWSAEPQHRAIYVGALDSMTRTRLLAAESKAIYAAAGHLLYLRGGTLMAQPFDASRLQFTGDAVRVASQVWSRLTTGDAAFYASDDGALVYEKMPAAGNSQWVWLDRSGTSTQPAGPRHNASFFSLSPDGKRIAFDEGVSGSPDVWMYDFDRDERTRLTTDSAADRHPIWSPDGGQIMFWSTRATTTRAAGPSSASPGRNAGGGLAGLRSSLFQVSTSGDQPDRIVLSANGGRVMVPWGWSRDGRTIVGQNFDPAKGPAAGDLWSLAISGDRKLVKYLATSFSEGEPALSPDGRWLAYVSNESGPFEVYVRPFPDATGGQWVISNDGGHFPRWRADGGELYYLDARRQVMAVSVKTAARFEVEGSQSLFTAPVEFPTIAQINLPYDVTGDGQRFLFSRPAEAATSTSEPSLTVVRNWHSTLKP
jgi:Tol biopolymer transport system component